LSCGITVFFLVKNSNYWHKMWHQVVWKLINQMLKMGMFVTMYPTMQYYQYIRETCCLQLWCS